jgi:chromosome segregation ATPase
MRSFSPFLALLVTVSTTTACATAVDMDTVNRRLDNNAKRIEALERTRADQRSEAATDTARKLDSLQQELESLRKDFADSKWTVGELTEKVESFGAFMDEVEQFMVQFRRKGGEIDKALEGLTNRLEADMRSLAEKLRKMLESESGK